MGRLVSSALRALLVLGGIALAYVALTFIQVWHASTQDQARPAQAVIVLGAAQYDGSPSPVLRARLDHAADLVQQDLVPVVVVTGGRRAGDRVTEARASADYLHQRGIPDAALRREVQGRNSWEQLAASARFLRREGINDVLLVSDPYHSYRIGAIAREVGLEAAVSPTKANRLSPPEQAKALLRETAAVAGGRIVGYRRLAGLRPLETADP